MPSKSPRTAYVNITDQDGILVERLEVTTTDIAEVRQDFGATVSTEEAVKTVLQTEDILQALVRIFEGYENTEPEDTRKQRSSS
jgi:hypothetical protein